MQPALRTIRHECMEVPVNTLSPRSNIDHLRKQAKDLLRAYRRAEWDALERIRRSLPAARGKDDTTLKALGLRLHDMQSCVAREQGCASWQALKDAVETLRAKAQDLDTLRLHWLRLVYGGDIAGGPGRPRPERAGQVLAEQPELVGDDAYMACAIGDEAALQRALEKDAGWIDRPGGPLAIPPVIAITHSTLATLASYREPLRRSLKALLDRGADPNQFVNNRRPPHSLENPGDERLTAIYGAAGKLHDEHMTRVLLAAGADANDNESLYHSIDDARPQLPCTKLLLEAGTRVPGTNALAKVLDFDNLAGLEMLLAHTPHAHPDLGHALAWAIYRGRSAQHVGALLDAGADPRALDAHRQAAHHHAARFGLPEVLRLLEPGVSMQPMTPQENFVAACARVDEVEARRLLRETPAILTSLSESQLKQLPNMAMSGRDDAVKLMVDLGWPIATRGGDIDGSALNWAVFRGNAALAEFLLERGASFREPHGYGSDVLGTLGWASVNVPPGPGDWPGCAAALLAHGMPAADEVLERDPLGELSVLMIDGRRMTVPDDVADVLLSVDA
jgi:ankyrin repeat protein